MKGRIDRNLCGNKLLFQHIKFQSDLFVEIFQRLAGEFPQHKLLEYHPRSKGSKVSKGYRLENCPYEVLDLIRDFDPKQGFNIRILQWWGHGLYFFVQVGTENLKSKISQFERLEGYCISSHGNPWEYAKLIEEKKEFSGWISATEPKEGHFFQIFKSIAIPEDPDSLLANLKREILSIMDNQN